VDAVDEEGFAATAAPCKIEDLLAFEARETGAGGVIDVEGAREAEGAVEEWAPDDGAVLDEFVDGWWGMNELFDLVGCRPCNSFSANIASWNK
jgi:hypothetical protein